VAQPYRAAQGTCHTPWQAIIATLKPVERIAGRVAAGGELVRVDKQGEIVGIGEKKVSHRHCGCAHLRRCLRLIQPVVD
jgi:hypothetical protein